MVNNVKSLKDTVNHRSASQENVLHELAFQLILFILD